MQTPTLFSPHQNPAHEIERYKALLSYEASALREEYKQNQEGARAGLRSIVDFASGAIKTLLLINGGAAIAILAFLGNAAAKDGSMSDVAAAMHALAPALNRFVIGVFAAGLTAGLAYLAQLVYFEILDKKRRLKIGNSIRVVALASAVASLIIFAVGAWSARDGLSDFGAHSNKAPITKTATEATPSNGNAPR